MSGSPEAEHKVEALAEATADANQLDEALKREVARIVVELHGNPHLGELMGDKPPRVLKGCRKVRFDEPDWRSKRASSWRSAAAPAGSRNRRPGKASLGSGAATACRADAGQGPFEVAAPKPWGRLLEDVPARSRASLRQQLMRGEQAGEATVAAGEALGSLPFDDDALDRVRGCDRRHPGIVGSC